jgi:HAMP domain-containing protein
MSLNGDEPRETAAVAAEMIQEIEAGSIEGNEVREMTDPEPKIEKPAAEKTVEKPVEKKDEKPVVEEDDDDFDKVPAEIDDPNPRNKGKKIENRLPHARVTKMVAKAIKKARETADTEWKAKHDPLAQNMENILADIRRLDGLMAGDPDAFLAEVGKAHPAYKEYVRQVKAAEKVAAAVEKPGPDVPNEKGEMVGYSIRQAEALMQYYADQAAVMAAKDAEEKYGPAARAVAGAARSAEERRQQAAVETAYESDATELLETANASWPGYKEHEKEIQDAFLANKKFRLYDAYIHVVIPKLQKAATNARSQVIEELKTTDIDTSVGGGAATRKTETGGLAQSTEEIARQIIREMEAAAR